MMQLMHVNTGGFISVIVESININQCEACQQLAASAN